MSKLSTTKRIPKKIPNPEYAALRAQERKENYDPSYDYPYEDLYPEELGKKLPEEGAWVILLIEVHVGEKVDEETVRHIDIPHLTVWYAMPHYLSAQKLHQAIIQTPEGQVHVWPHEYNLFDIQKFLPFLGEGFDIHFMAESGGFSEEALFYIRSRGISKAEAQMMLLPTLKDPHFCYFTFAEEFRECFPSGTGTPYLFHSNHERRRQAHARRA